MEEEPIIITMIGAIDDYQGGLEEQMLDRVRYYNEVEDVTGITKQELWDMGPDQAREAITMGGRVMLKAYRESGDVDKVSTPTGATN